MLKLTKDKKILDTEQRCAWCDGSGYLDAIERKCPFCEGDCIMRLHDVADDALELAEKAKDVFNND